MTYSVELKTIIFKEFMSTDNQSGVGLMLGEKFLFFQHDKVMFHMPFLCNGQVVLSRGHIWADCNVVGGITCK
jgi:hypothetical protein